MVCNVFIPVAPIRRDFHKKLHKVLHLFLLRTFGARYIVKTSQTLLAVLNQNLVARFCRERNVFITTAPIRRSLHKKLHKVSYQFSFGLRPCKIVRTVKIIALNIESKSCAKIL